MKLNRLLLAAALPVVLVACGGGGDSEEQQAALAAKSGPLYRINGQMNPTLVEIQQVEVSDDSLENCDTDNKSVVEALDGGIYCDHKWDYASFVFQWAFVNNSLEPLPLTFTGTGVTVRIKTLTGEEVWTSDAYFDVLKRISGDTAGFDPAAITTKVLAPAENEPSQRTYSPNGYVFNFAVFQNYSDPDPNSDVFDPNSVIAEPAGQCSWNPEDLVEPDPLNPVKKRDVISCQSPPITPGTYILEIDFSYNDWQDDPAPITLVIKPKA